MFDETMSQLPATVVICAAAVADWKLIPDFKNLSQTNLMNKIKKLKKPLLQYYRKPRYNIISSSK